MKNLETEFKWEVTCGTDFRRAKGVFAALSKMSAPVNLKICDTYLDHADERFAKEKIAFRVRKVNGIWQATFKTRSEIKNGKAVRREETLPLPSVHSVTQALAYLTQKKTWKKLDVRDLQKRFVIKNHRRAFNLIYKKCQAELALDTFVIFAGGHEMKIREIELELKHGNAKDFEELAARFTAQSGLSFSTISKVKTAEALRAME